MISDTNFPAYLGPFLWLPGPAVAQTSGRFYISTFCTPQKELDQPLPLLAIFAIQITFSFCTAFLLEKRCAGVDG